MKGADMLELAERRARALDARMAQSDKFDEYLEQFDLPDSRDE